jgi:hypothetical protein
MKKELELQGVYEAYIRHKLPLISEVYQVRQYKFESMVTIKHIILMPLLEPVEVIRALDADLAPHAGVRCWWWMPDDSQLAGCMCIEVWYHAN